MPCSTLRAFACDNSSDIHHSFTKVALVFPFYVWGYWDPVWKASFQVVFIDPYLLEFMPLFYPPSTQINNLLLTSRIWQRCWDVISLVRLQKVEISTLLEDCFLPSQLAGFGEADCCVRTETNSPTSTQGIESCQAWMNWEADTTPLIINDQSLDYSLVRDPE